MADPLEKVLEERGTTHGDYDAICETDQQFKGMFRRHPGWNMLSPTQRTTLEMIGLKISRILCGNPDFAEHWLDAAGYAKKMAEKLIEDAKREEARNGRAA